MCVSHALSCFSQWQYAVERDGSVHRIWNHSFPFVWLDNGWRYMAASLLGFGEVKTTNMSHFKDGSQNGKKGQCD